MGRWLLAAVAGTVIAFSQGDFGNAVVNGAGLVAVGGVAFFDLRLQGEQVSQAKEYMQNEQLGKDVWTEAKKKSPADEGGTAGSALPNTPQPGKILNAEDLFATQEETEQ